MAHEVVLVEDDGAQAEALRWALEAAGLRVRVFASAEEAMAGALPGKALVTDYRLPGKDGLWLADRISARAGWPVPILIVSARFDGRVEKAVAETPNLTAMEKPVAVDRLLAWIEGDPGAST